MNQDNTTNTTVDSKPKEVIKMENYKAGVAIIQDQLRNIPNFTGAPDGISWDLFEFKFTGIMQTAPELPEAIKLSFLMQKIEGAPSELIRLNPEYQRMGYDELLNWLALRHQDIQVPPQELCIWQTGDTPDQYYVRLMRRAEYDLPPMPPRKIYKKNDDGETKLKDGKPIMIDNPEFEH